MRRNTSYVRNIPPNRQIHPHYNVEYVDFNQHQPTVHAEDTLYTLKSINSMAKSLTLLLMSIFCISSLVIASIENHIRDTHNKLYIANINNDRLEFQKNSTKSLYNLLDKVRNTHTLNKPIDIITIKSTAVSKELQKESSPVIIEQLPSGY